jgi:hypothetical protein
MMCPEGPHTPCRYAGVRKPDTRRESRDRRANVPSSPQVMNSRSPLHARQDVLPRPRMTRILPAWIFNASTSPQSYPTPGYKWSIRRAPRLDHPSVTISEYGSVDRARARRRTAARCLSSGTAFTRRIALDSSASTSRFSMGLTLLSTCPVCISAISTRGSLDPLRTTSWRTTPLSRGPSWSRPS